MFEIHEDDDGMGWSKGGVTPVHIPQSPVYLDGEQKILKICYSSTCTTNAHNLFYI